MDELDLLTQFNALQNVGRSQSRALLDYDLTGTPRDYSNDSTQDFQRSKEDENTQNLYANIMSVVGNMNKNLTGATPNTELVQGLRADARNMGEMWRQQQEQKASDIKLTKANIDIDTEKDKANPASGVSNLYRNFIKDRLHINVDDNTSAAQLEKMLPVLRTLGLGGMGGRDQYQMIRVKDPNDPTGQKNITVAVNKFDPTDRHVVGDTSYAMSTILDPKTKERKLFDPASGQASNLDRSAIGGEVTPSKPSIQPINVAQRDFIQDKVKEIKGGQTYTGAEKTLANVPTINALIRDALKKGGQSLSMLGPVVAKALAGETGVLTDQDVIRYVANPALIGGIKDWIARYAKGQTSEESAKNLLRLTEIMEKEAKQKAARSMALVTGPLMAQYGMDETSANHYVNSEFFPKQATVEELLSLYAPEALSSFGGAQTTSPSATPAPTPVQAPTPNERIINGVKYIKTDGGWKRA